MSENKSIKILMDDESCEENQKSAKDLEDEKRAEKEAQQKLVSVINYHRKHYNITLTKFDYYNQQLILLIVPIPKNFHVTERFYEKLPFFTDCAFGLVYTQF